MVVIYNRYLSDLINSKEPNQKNLGPNQFSVQAYEFKTFLVGCGMSVGTGEGKEKNLVGPLGK